jgi:hypothetical protein
MQDFNLRGFTIARGVFSESECDAYITYFMDMVERGGDGWAEVDVEPEHEDPLMRYPRLLQPHRGDDGAFNFMVDERLRVYLTALCGTEPFAVQTMVYFKPPGARGQNLHQDNTYLKVQPGTCIAAWLALDECDEENGCMMLVPDSQDLPILCQKHTPGLEADCWWNRETPVPPGLELVPAHMKRGDVLLFGGSVIHGSYKNRSNRFRRTLIGHYIAAETHQVAKYYFPVFRFDGTQLTDEIRPAAEDGGPCGVYVETEQGQELVMAGSYEEARGPH